MGCKLIGYRRVSTNGQADSGLGQEGQTADIEKYVKATGCDLVKVYDEVETATGDEVADRPQLWDACHHAKRIGATLVIAKLDRLARSVPVLAELRKMGVKFVACDNPHANELTVDILMAVAADEGRRISQRTKDALAAYKARGGLLGGARPECRNLTQEARERGARAAGEAAKRAADEAYPDLVPKMKAWRAEGLSQQAIADRLNADGQMTRREKPWTYIAVANALKRATRGTT